MYNEYAKIMSEANYKWKYGERLKILTPKQILQRLPLSLAQVKTSNNSENLLNEIRQIVYSLYQSKEMTKRLYNNINQYKYKMDIIFINSENSRTSKLHILILKLTGKLDLKRGEKGIAKNVKSLYNDNKSKISSPTWNDTFELLNGSHSLSDIQDYFEYI